jgi:hypothetical protein
MATSFSGGRSRSTQREVPTMGKQLVKLLSLVESSALFFVIYKAGKMNLSMQLSKNNDFSHILLSLITL